MKASDIPTKFQIPFANSAGGSFIRPIPVASQIGIQDGAASLTTGFVPDNFLPLAGGGVPPFGADMNGILNQSTAWDRWFSAGGPLKFDSAFSALIGGYPQGAIVASTATVGLFWLCLVDDNTTTPDSGGANWQAFSFNSQVNGQCYFELVSTISVQVIPYGGSGIVINGQSYQIPVGGIAANITACRVNETLTALAPSTVYNVFLYLQGGVPTLDFCTGVNGAHIRDTNPQNIGIEVRAIGGVPNSAYTLVGKAATNSSGQLFTGQGYSVISWFNRRSLRVTGSSVAGPIAITATSPTEIDASGRLSVLSWGNEATAVSCVCNGASNNVSGGSWTFRMGINGTPEGTVAAGYSAVGGQTAGGNVPYYELLTEGLNVLGLYGSTQPGGSTSTFSQMILTGTVKG